jgi:hypothetical protein
MKNLIAKIILQIFTKKSKNCKKVESAKLFNIYLDSVGKKFYRAGVGQEVYPNKEYHKQVWNKKIQKKSDYELFKSSNF